MSHLAPEMESSGCILWTGKRSSRGYGEFEALIGGEKRAIRAHRYAWMRENGPIPEGLVVLHSCDNPSCCNLGHLSVGTNKDNTLDALSKGRMARGERCGNSRLTEKQARAILAETRSQDRPSDRKIADKFGVHNNTVQMIRAGKTWAWLR